MRKRGRGKEGEGKEGEGKSDWEEVERGKSSGQKKGERERIDY